MRNADGLFFRIGLSTMKLTAALLLLANSMVMGQNWYTPVGNMYPNRIDGFAGRKSVYGYNDEGDLYRSIYNDPVPESRWSMSMRGSLHGLNFIEPGLEYAVGNNGSLWRTSFDTSGFFVRTETVTNADLLHICVVGYTPNHRCFAVGRRGTIIEYVPKTDLSRIVEEGQHPDLRSIAWITDQTLVAVGDSGCILLSTDRGSSWRRSDQNPDYHYRSVAVYDHRLVILTGCDSRSGEAIVIRTNPTFTEWIENRFPGHREVSGMRMFGAHWIVFGDNGLLAQTPDTARSWLTCLHGTRIHFSDVWINYSSITAVGKSPIDGHFRSVISVDSGRNWMAWIEPEDSLGSIRLSRTMSYSTPLVTEQGYVFNLESSYEYPLRVELSVPFALYSCTVVNHFICIVGGEGGRILRSNHDRTCWQAAAPLSDDVIGLESWRRSASVLALTRDSRIYRSNDSGAVWHLAYAAPAGRTITRILCEFSDTCLAIGHEDNRSAAWISLDGGYQWNTVLEYDLEITGVDVDSAGAIYVCTSDGKLFRTSDNGKHWTVPLMRDGARFTDVSAGSRTHITLVEGSDRILGSTDRGDTWNEHQFPGQNFERIQSWDGSWLAWGGNNSILSVSEKTRLSDRLGSCRETLNAAVSDTAYNVISVGEKGAILVQNWIYSTRWETRRVLAPVSVDLHSIATWNSTELLAVGDSGVVLRSARPGFTWEIMHRDPAARTLTQVFTFPSGLAFAAGPDVLLRFTPAESAWMEELRYPGGYLAAPALYGWYAAVPNGRVFFSEDNGRRWSERSTLPHAVRACHAFNAENVYALCFDTSNGTRRSIVYRSTDYAATWETVFQMVGDFSAMRLFDGSRVILIGEEGTVFVSDNFGRTWIKTRSRFRTKFNEIVPVHVLSHSTPEYLFIANQREMDILLMREPVLAHSEPPSLPERISLAALYPNPASQVIQVHVSGEMRSQCRLSLHDLLGREVWADRFDLQSDAGFRTTIDVIRFARGVYILRLGGRGVNESRLVQLR